MLKKIFAAYLLIFSLYFPAEVLAETSKEEKIPEEIKKLRNLRRSQINISKDDFKIRVKVYLFAEDEKMQILEGSYCGGADGDKQYTGNYQLISVKDNKIVSRIDLGEYEFIENTFDGLEMFVPVFGEQLIAIYQYGSCNNQHVEFFRIDEKGILHKVKFFDKNGTVTTGRATFGDIKRADEGKRDGNIIFCSYDNYIAYEFCDSYAYDGKDFIQTSEWMGQYSYDAYKKNTIIAKARRVLYEFLSALEEKKYKRAVYYYGGDYGLLLKLNPDVSSSDKSKLFEQYCIKNGGKCEMPTYFKDMDVKSSIKLKFSVKLMNRDFQDIIIDGKSDFEFRVKRVKGEFKVMDLPPYAPN